jgi:hypothetical protein
MKRSGAAWLMIGLGCSVAAVAQQPAIGESVTVSGCLERAQLDGSAGGTVVGTSASPSTADTDASSGLLVDAYMLTDATPVATDTDKASDRTTASSTTGTDTTAGTTGRVGTPTAYGLVGHEAELSSHTGARVEVTGPVVAPATSGRGSGGAATASGVKRVRVASFKVLGERCSTR